MPASRIYRCGTYRFSWSFLISASVCCILNICLATTTWAQASSPSPDTSTPSSPSMGPALKAQLKLPVKNTQAETLHAITQVTINADSSWQRRRYVSIRVNDNDAARDFGRISIPFNHYYAKLNLDFANTISKDGKISSLSEDALQQRITGGGQDFYSDSSELVFSLPDISPGSILEFQYTQSSEVIPFEGLHANRATPYWFQSTVSNDGWRADYVHDFRISIDTPKELPLHTKTFSGFPEKHTTTHKRGRKQYTWKMRDISEIRSESWMPVSRTFIPTLNYSTIDNWQAVDAWSWEKIEDKLKPTSDIKKIIADFRLPSNTNNEEKVKIVYDYLQKNIRYVFAHLGRGGYEPHTPDDVLAVNYGDCKDQSVLTVALLRAMGVMAYPALVETPRAGDSDTDQVSLMFDHMIVHIPASEGVPAQWLDTTGDRSLYPGMSNYLAGQNAFIINGQGGELTHIPDLGDNHAYVDVDYAPTDSGGYRAKVHIRLQGGPEQNIRNWWIHSTDRENALNQYLASMFNAYTSLTAKVKNAENLWQPTEISAEFEFAKDEKNPIPAYGASITQASRLFTNAGNLPLPDTRITDFYDKYPLNITMNISAYAEQGQLPALVQTVDPITTPYLSTKYESRIKEQDFYLTLRYQKPKLNLDKAAYKTYYDAIQGLINSNIWLVKMLDTGSGAKLVAQPSGKQKAENLIAQARTLLEQGKFNEALAPARAAVDLKNTSGEAWYVLGMAQGFNALIEESTASFEKAEQLGFIP